jgi:hypothetical protein
MDLDTPEVVGVTPMDLDTPEVVGVTPGLCSVKLYIYFLCQIVHLLAF